MRRVGKSASRCGGGMTQAVTDRLREIGLVPVNPVDAQVAAEAAETIDSLCSVLRNAIDTLAASRFLIIKYDPDHHWIPTHDKRIQELRRALAGVDNPRAATQALPAAVERMKRELERQQVPFASFPEVSEGTVVIYHSPAVELTLLAGAARGSE